MCLERIAADAQTPLQASKWQHIAVLLDVQELSELIEEISPIRLFRIGSVCAEENLECSTEQFLTSYADYISLLSGSEPVQDRPYRAAFTLAWTDDLQALYAVEVANGKVIVRPRTPVIQVQLHRLAFSSVDRAVRSMVHGENAISWGVQFGFPQLYRDTQTQRILAGKDFAHTPNARKFRTLQRWIRHHTLPTPFLIDGQRTNSPIRLGRNCFSWIAQHPDLAQYDLTVETMRETPTNENGKPS